MRSTRYLSGVLALGLLCTLIPLRPAAAQTAAKSPRAEILGVEGAVTTYQVEGQRGQMVTVDVPSNNIADVKLSDPVEGTVRGKVVALDAETNRVKVHTQEGQIVILAIPRETIMGMRLGDPFVLAVPKPAGR